MKHIKLLSELEFQAEIVINWMMLAATPASSCTFNLGETFNSVQEFYSKLLSLIHKISGLKIGRSMQVLSSKPHW